MGNRVKGRPKRKGIKAAIGSNAGSQRKLSRMGKHQKKEHSGLDATFIGRSACLKLLQVSIADFRRLCILKGIYPREPRGNRVPGNKQGQSYYHMKDIRAIAHEPILEKFREFRSFMKKVRRAAGRNERNEAQRIHSILPTYNLNRLVKERYPRFIDAISDLDDALTLTYLFAALPAVQERNLESKWIRKAQTLSAAWGAYCATTAAVTKSFISVKGIYMEAHIHSTPVRWIIPHAFTQFLPEDVDFRVMTTFLEFYDTLLNFILYKLYSDIGVRYPFHVKDLGSEYIGSTSARLGANLRALTKASTQEGTIGMIVSESVRVAIKDDDDGVMVAHTKITKKKSKELVQSVAAALQTLPSDDDDDNEEEDKDDDVDMAGPLQAALENAAQEEARASLMGGNPSMNHAIHNEDDDEVLKRKCLFAGLTFFMSREVPRGYIELVALSFGAKIGWEGTDSPISMKDPSITHHIMDRPTIPSSYESSLPKSREYVQPQWILDCTNFMYLLPIARYGVGVTLPPHLSPWVDDEEEGYKPKYAEEIERLKNGEPIDMDETTEENDNSLDHAPVATSEQIEELVVDEEPDIEKVDDQEGEDDDDDDNDSDAAKERKEKKRKLEEEEAHRLAKTMMSRKASHLYGRMQHGIAKKKAKVESLNQRRKELIVDPKDKGKERDGLGRLIITGKEKDDTGKTANKLKVERLKEERKSLENTYNKTGGTMKKNKRIRP